MDVENRLAEMPILAQRLDGIDSRYFNVWRRARARFGKTIRLALPGLKQMELVLTDGYWVCVDAVQNDCPILAWVNIEGAGRDALHSTVQCKLNYYHFAASALRARVLDAMERELEKRLKSA